MVLVERNPENVRNGRRSRGPSPANNGHGGTPESSSDDDSTKKIGNKTTKAKSEYEEKIRVGRDYQVTCPDLIPIQDRKPEQLNDRALLVWSPTKDIPENKLEEYISVAKEKYGYNGEQALGMLFWHKHDLERAVLDLANFTPFPDEWTVEDKVLFEQAFQFHGKSFHRVRQMLPDKSIASLVKYYYSWKKTRSRTSVMDRQEKMKAKEGSENGSENGSNEESDPEEKVQNNKQMVSTLKRKNSEAADDIRPPESTNRINSRWNNEEYLLAVQGIRKFGKDFQAIAETIGTKTEAQVRTFFVNYRRRYDLDTMLKEFETNSAQKQQQQQQLQQTPIQIEPQQQQQQLEEQPSIQNSTTNRPEVDADVLEIDLDESPITTQNKDEDEVEEVAIISEKPAVVDNGLSATNITTAPLTETDSTSNQNAEP